MNDGIGGPYLAGAFLCEKILREADGVHSFIRVIDRITARFGGEPRPLAVDFELVLMFKSGSARQKLAIKVKLVSPTGQGISEFNTSALFEGDERGVNLFTHLNMTLPEEGLYWFEIYVEDGLVTKIPLRLLYHTTSVSKESSEP